MPDALAGLVGAVLALGDHALGIPQPLFGAVGIGRGRAEVDRRVDDLYEAVAALGLRQLEQRLRRRASAGRRR
jgi:hypothetical protein